MSLSSDPGIASILDLKQSSAGMREVEGRWPSGVMITDG